MPRIHLYAALLMLGSSQAGGQPLNAPPIPPEQVLRQQNAPLPSIPAPVPQVPSEPSPRAPALPRTPAIDASRDRAAACQHQAAVERVPHSRRDSYIHNCMN